MKINFMSFMVTLAFLASGFFANAQVCDVTVTPSGLTSTYTPGSGVLLSWHAVPGSAGVSIKVIPSSGGSSFERRMIGFEMDQYLVPERYLSPGTYTWQIQAGCSLVFPYDVTFISASDSFTIAGTSSCPLTLTDIDGNIYVTVEIFGQCWMKENLKVEHYRNGDVIPMGLDNAAWAATTTGAAAVMNNDTVNKAVYGLLYNWYTVDDSRGLCPAGWHVPRESEWRHLTDQLGGRYNHGGELKTTGTLLAGTGLWDHPNTSATNNTGFSGLPGGNRNYGTGLFHLTGEVGWWWSSTESTTTTARWRGLNHDRANVSQNSSFKNFGKSVRCIQD